MAESYGRDRQAFQALALKFPKNHPQTSQTVTWLTARFASVKVELKKLERGGRLCQETAAGL